MKGFLSLKSGTDAVTNSHVIGRKSLPISVFLQHWSIVRLKYFIIPPSNKVWGGILESPCWSVGRAYMYQMASWFVDKEVDGGICHVQ